MELCQIEPMTPDRTNREPALWATTTFERTVLAGTGSLERLPDILRALGIRRVFVIANERPGRPGFEAVAQRAINGIEVFQARRGVAQHAPFTDIEQLFLEAQDSQPDAVLAYGGGSCTDSAKSVSALLSGRSLELDREALSQSEIPIRTVPIITIPTTLAGAEFSNAAAITVPGVKRYVGWPGLAARVTVYDPSTIAGVPSHVLLTTGLNGLAHAVEAAYGPRRNPISDALSVEGARLFTSGLLALSRGDRSMRTLGELQDAAVTSAMALSHAGTLIHHSVCHVLGARFGLSHGVANSVMLPYSVAFNEEFTSAAQARLAAVVGSVMDAAGVPHGPLLPDCLHALQAALGVPTNLRSAGLEEASLVVLRDDVLRQEPGLDLNPRPITPASLDLLLEAAMSGSLVRLRRSAAREIP